MTFPVRGCRCLTWPAAAALKGPQLTLSWEPVGTHGDASALQGKEGESTSNKRLRDVGGFRHI